MIIGLVGGIGSGKSTVAKQLEKMGYAVYDSDMEAKRIIVHNPKVRTQVEDLFGKEAFEDDVYRTDVVSKQVFHDRTLLKRLGEIVHPAVVEDVRIQGAKHAQEGKDTIVECAVLFESGIYRACDKIVLVSAPEEIRLVRTMQRDHRTEEQVRARIHSQLSEEEMKQKSDFVLVNDGTQTIENLCLSLKQHL